MNCKALWRHPATRSQDPYNRKMDPVDKLALGLDPGPQGDVMGVPSIESKQKGGILMNTIVYRRHWLLSLSYRFINTLVSQAQTTIKRLMTEKSSENQPSECSQQG